MLHYFHTFKKNWKEFNSSYSLMLYFLRTYKQAPHLAIRATKTQGACPL